MSPDPPDPPRASRIIVPGQEHAEPAGEAPPASGSRIVLPPGATTEPEESLPEYPRLRPLEIMPVLALALMLVLLPLIADRP